MNRNYAPRTSAAIALSSSLREFFAGSAMQHATKRWRTRFAPAPTGYLHLGHVVNAIHVWGIARAFAGLVVLRIEDHDRTRCRKEFEGALLDDLDWLGLVPDRGHTETFRAGATLLRQSDNRPAYSAHLRRLEWRGLTYACQCSRRDIAGHAAGDTSGELRYPGTCASLTLDASVAPATRVRVTSATEQFADLRLGVQHQCPNDQCGDFVVHDRHGNFSYQLAVTVDDWEQDIAVVIRGEDLLSSTGRQLQLARLLGRLVPPTFLHHTLVLRDDGRKLSKSLGDTGVREMRAAGCTPGDVLGRAAFASGLIDTATSLAVDDLRWLFQ